MIESNVINWLDLNDQMQNLDVYGHQRLLYFFNFMRVLCAFKNTNVFFHIITKLICFLQILSLSLGNVISPEDLAVRFLKSVSQVVLIHNSISNKSTYSIALLIVSILTVITILLLIYFAISLQMGKFISKVPVIILNLILSNFGEVLIGPIIQICLLAFKCSEGNKHDYLNETCYSSGMHWVFLLVSIFNLLFWIAVNVVISIYFNEIGSINNAKVSSRTNCNYEFIVIIVKIVMFIFGYFVNFYCNGDSLVNLLFLIFLTLASFAIGIYIYHEVFYYNMKLHFVIEMGWIFSAWFCLIIIVKTVLTINDTLIFHLIGWLILACIVYYLENSKKEFLVTDFNIFEIKRLKDIELFNATLLGLMDKRSMKSKALLVGLTKKFEEFAAANPDVYERFNKLSQNDHLKKQFNSNSALPILSIIFILYEHHLDKSVLKNDILLNMCYFLINSFKNPTFAVSLCSKFKVEDHIHLYYKFVLMEEIKEFFVNKLSKNSNKESIKHVEVGSVILYNIYNELFKLRIYDATCNQIDYFDILKNTMITPKTTEHFLKLGEDILSIRKEILTIWEKIIELNPFSDECERDYMLYLELILQDDLLARQEEKKYITLKNSKLSEKNNIYHSMFVRELSTVALVDGYSSNGKFLYTTPNFPALFNFTGKEILNLSVDDLLPNVVGKFHKDLIDNAIKYSNINYIFNTQKDMLLKGKTGGIYNIKLYVKSIPNLSFGLIYVVQISKVTEHNYIIVLDKEFKIDGLTDLINQGEGYTMANNYGLTQSLCGHHIGLALPEILLQLEYKNEEFKISKDEIDLKGTLYPISIWKELDNKVENILSKIKQYGKLQYDEDNQNNNTFALYDDLIKEITSRYQKSFSVYYKIVTKTFLDGKHKYYRLYITNDLMTLNENSHLNPTPSGLISNHKNDKGDNNANASSNNNNNNQSSNKKSKASTKQIRWQLMDRSEKKLLGDEDKANPDNADKANDVNAGKKSENNLLLQNKLIQRDAGYSSAPSSRFTKSSLDSASFNKLKNGILDKKEIQSVRIMKYSSLLFVVLTIILIILDSNTIESNFEDLRDYLQQNLFFNHSKITVSCIYLSTLNLKWVKDGFIPETNCELNKTCSLFYSQLLSDCIDDIKIQKENSSKFYEDFKSLLNLAKDIQLDVYNLTTKDTLSIDIDNLLNLLISNGLKLNANLVDYYNGENIYDINSLNLLDQSINFLTDDNVVGFDNIAKKNKINEHFSPLQVSLIIDCIFVVLFFLFFGYLILKLNEMEKKYLFKLIEFRTANFETYLKTLDELKKKLRNENGDEDGGMNEFDAMELSSKKGSKDGEGDEKGKKGKSKGKDVEDKKSKKDDDSSSENEKDKENNRRRKARRQRISKQNKMHQQRLEKKKVMSKYFLKWNIILTLKILFVLLISFSYYIVVSFIERDKKEDYLEFDSTTDGIEGVFKESFDIFLKLKIELAKYENFEVARTKAIKTLLQHPNQPVMFNGVEYTSPNDIQQLPSYYMQLPNNNELVIPKLGNLLMPLVNDLSGASDATMELNELYNEDACLILFRDKENEGYDSCSHFWSGIIVKGLEQAITQMGVVINTVIDELNALNLEGMNAGGSSTENQNRPSSLLRELDNETINNTFQSLLLTTSGFSQYEIFIEYYLFYGYMKTVSLLSSLKQVKVKSIYNTFVIILYSYIVGVVLLFFVLVYLIYSSKVMFNTFLNFVGIFPLKYLMEDDALYKDVLRLEQHIF